MPHGGYAVIDFETTGLSPKYHHRVIEIGLVHVAPDGQVEDSFETVLNPGRDLGPTHIHGLRGADVTDAPRFDDVAGRLLDLLRGRVLVAHNARFETSFLRAELARLGVASPLADDGALCTMKLATTYLPGSGRKLADCCAAFDIPLVDAHEALADARATAQLLGSYLDAGKRDRHVWQQWGDYASALPWPARPSGSAGWTPRRRGVTTRTSEPSFLDRATDLAAPLDGTDGETAYAGMLDRALSDGFLSLSESQELADLASSLGLSSRRRAELHRDYFDAVVHAAWSDGVVTPAERAEIEAVATMLDITTFALQAALSPTAARYSLVEPAARVVVAAEPAVASSTSTVSAPSAPTNGASLNGVAWTLGAGDVVVLTGEMSSPRSHVEALVTATGAEVRPGVTKKTTLLVAADPDSLSGKAQKARQYGVPILAEDELHRLLRAA